jgi:hypothetical protein
MTPKNFISAVASLAVAAGLAACGGSDFEWFPTVPDTTPPVVTAKAQSAGAIFKNTSSTTIPLPDRVVFTANEPATIYYTTTGDDPVIPDSPHISIPKPFDSNEWPLIEEDNTILKILGVDKAGNKTALSYTIMAE